MGRDGGTPESPPESLEAPAREACLRSVALSPGWPRGAALLTRTGRIFAGAQSRDPDGSVEACAERAAVYQALMAGSRSFSALLVRAGARGRGDGGPPCGACLQVLLEFSPGMRVWWGTSARPRGGKTVRELLPGAFGLDHLRRAVPLPRRRERAQS